MRQGFRSYPPALRTALASRFFKFLIGRFSTNPALYARVLVQFSSVIMSSRIGAVTVKFSSRVNRDLRPERFSQPGKMALDTNPISSANSAAEFQWLGQSKSLKSKALTRGCKFFVSPSTNPERDHVMFPCMFNENLVILVRCANCGGGDAWQLAN